MDYLRDGDVSLPIHYRELFLLGKQTIVVWIQQYLRGMRPLGNQKRERRSYTSLPRDVQRLLKCESDFGV